jgi:transposase-like protein
MNTADQLCARILMANIPEADRKRRLQALASSMKVAMGHCCPSCGSSGPHEDNGMTRRSELTYLCTSCGHQWDAEPG